tara:strand:+ start:330 stop:446 length:117 start_codon:yes stop_codon:yes gene_type:complete
MEHQALVQEVVVEQEQQELMEGLQAVMVVQEEQEFQMQ